MSIRPTALPNLVTGKYEQGGLRAYRSASTNEIKTASSGKSEATAVLEARFARTRRGGADWLLLRLYRVLGYGRAPGRCLVIWLCLALSCILWRLWEAYRHS
jgi:hypothetical protein